MEKKLSFRNKSQDTVWLTVRQNNFLLDIVIFLPNLSSASVFCLGTIIASSSELVLFLKWPPWLLHELLLLQRMLSPPLGLVNFLTTFRSSKCSHHSLIGQRLLRYALIKVFCWIRTLIQSCNYTFISVII